MKHFLFWGNKALNRSELSAHTPPQKRTQVLYNKWWLISVSFRWVIQVEQKKLFNFVQSVRNTAIHLLQYVFKYDETSAQKDRVQRLWGRYFHVMHLIHDPIWPHRQSVRHVLEQFLVWFSSYLCLVHQKNTHWGNFLNPEHPIDNPQRA